MVKDLIQYQTELSKYMQFLPCRKETGKLSPRPGPESADAPGGELTQLGIEKQVDNHG